MEILQERYDHQVIQKVREHFELMNWNLKAMLIRHPIFGRTILTRIMDGHVGLGTTAVIPEKQFENGEDESNVSWLIRALGKAVGDLMHRTHETMVELDAFLEVEIKSGIHSRKKDVQALEVIHKKVKGLLGKED